MNVIYVHRWNLCISLCEDIWECQSTLQKIEALFHCILFNTWILVSTQYSIDANPALHGHFGVVCCKISQSFIPHFGTKGPKFGPGVVHLTEEPFSFDSLQSSCASTLAWWSQGSPVFCWFVNAYFFYTRCSCTSNITIGAQPQKIFQDLLSAGYILLTNMLSAESLSLQSHCPCRVSDSAETMFTLRRIFAKYA